METKTRDTIDLNVDIPNEVWHDLMYGTATSALDKKLVNYILQLKNNALKYIVRIEEIQTSLEITTQKLLLAQAIRSLEIIHSGLFKTIQNIKSFKTGRPVELLHASH